MTGGRRTSCQLAKHNRTESLEDRLDVLFGQLGMDRRDVNSVVVLGLFLNLIDDLLLKVEIAIVAQDDKFQFSYRLRHVGRPPNFDVSSAKHGTVHLLQSQLRSLRDLILDEGEAFVLLRDRIPRHVDRLDWSKWKKRGADCVLLQLE